MITEHFYMTDLGKIAYVALYLPLVLGLLWLLYRKCFRKVGLAWPLTAVVAVVLRTLPFWDVYMISRNAERLCREQAMTAPAYRRPGSPAPRTLQHQHYLPFE